MTAANANSTPATPPAATRRSGNLWLDAIRRLRRSKVAMVSLAVIAIYFLTAFIGPLFLPDWIGSEDYTQKYQSPSMAHPLGTDNFGQDVATKTILAARVSLMVGLVTNLIAVPLGILLGALAGYFGKRVDDIIVWLFSTLAAIPGLILVIAIKFAFASRAFEFTLFGHTYEVRFDGMIGIYLALSVVAWIGTCRLVRAETLKLRDQDFVLAAKASGRGSFSILIHHIVPNVLHIGVIQFSLGFIGAIMAEVTLSFLNIGVPANIPSWGTMINAAREDLIIGRWWEFTAAAGAMFVLILAINLFGDRLRDALDPKLKR
jgi:ABC-type dipeptide/oligopeptide/nickel transport system permease subunit